MQWPMDVDFVKYLSGKSSKLLKVKHHDIPGVFHIWQRLYDCKYTKKVQI